MTSLSDHCAMRSCGVGTAGIGPRYGGKHLLLLLLFASALAAAPVRGDDDCAHWVRVATSGLGDPDRRQVNALAIHGEAVYLATRRAEPPLRSHVFRAALSSSALRGNASWSELTPDWGDETFGHEITGMVVVGTRLYVGHSAGHIWRLDPELDRWVEVPRDWEGAPEVLALGAIPTDSPGSRSEMLCAALAGPRLFCLEGGASWRELDLPPELVSGSRIWTATLAGSRTFPRLNWLPGLRRSWLYYGIGGDTRVGRRCELWRAQPGRVGWQPVTTDCFGNPSQAHLPAMAVRGDSLFATASGGDDMARIFKVGPGLRFQEVTPRELWSPSGSPFDPTPSTFPALVATRNLYVGDRLGFWGGEVLQSFEGFRRRGDDDPERFHNLHWEFSCRGGFDNPANQVISAMASGGAFLYAGTFNGETGFEVWRRGITQWTLDDIEAAALGGLIGAGLILVLRFLQVWRELQTYSIGLALAAAVYVGFAAVGGGAEALLLATAGVVLFTVIAVLGWRRSPIILSAGWAAHAAWDLVSHPLTGAYGYAPAWYAALCFGFSLVLAAYLLVARHRLGGESLAEQGADVRPAV